jgi:hypothetical protein
MQTALVCLPLIFLTYFWTHKSLDKAESEIAELKQKLDIYADVPADNINQQATQTTSKLQNFRNIRVRSDIALLLVRVPKLLPPGTWIKNFAATYSPDQSATGIETSKPTLIIKGYAYHEDPKEQFQLINQFLKNLEKDEKLSSIFAGFSLETSEGRLSNDVNATYFEITCE